MENDATHGEHDEVGHRDAQAGSHDADGDGSAGVQAEQWRKSVRDHEADRYRLAARASSTLLLAIVAIAATVAFGGASLVGQALGRDRLVMPLAVASSVALVAGVALAWRYRKDAAALRAHQRAYPGLWDEVESRLRT